MNFHVLMLVFSGLLLGADKAKHDGMADHKKIQGTWALTTAKDSGKDQVKGIEHFKLIVTANHFRLEFQDKVLQKFTYQLNPSKQPKWIDVTEIVDGKAQDPARGIYELKGDTLKICFPEFRRKDSRSTAFESKRDSVNDVLLIGKRENA